MSCLRSLVASDYVAILDMQRVAFSCCNCPNPWECTMDMNGSIWSARMLIYVSPVRVVSWRIRVTISVQLHKPHTSIEPLLAWTVPCWHAGFMDLWGCLGNETRQTRQHVSSHQQSDVGFDEPRRGVSKDIRVGLRLRKPISIMFLWMVCILILVGGPALKTAEIYGRVAHLSCWTILFSCHWSRSCMILFGRSYVGYLMFYRIPDIHGALVKSSYR